MPIAWPDKDPDDVLDYGTDLSALVGDEDDVLTTSQASVISGDVVIVQHDVVQPEQKTVTWLSGGTVGSNCQIRIRTTTQKGRRVDVTAVLKIAER